MKRCVNLMKKVSKDDIKFAKNVSTLSYLQAQGFDFVKKGNCYSCKEHDSLIVRNDENHWYWNALNKGGYGAISFIMKIDNETFQTAVSKLCNNTAKASFKSPKQQSEIEEKREFVLRPHNDNNKRVFAFLTKTRLIDKNIVNDCINNGTIYEDNHHNVVILGLDNNGIARGGQWRTTSILEEHKKYRGELSGSNKDYGFVLKAENNSKSNSVCVFEGFGDTLAFATIVNKSKLANNDKGYYKNFNFLTLGGTCKNALNQFLKDNKQVNTVILWLDNDKAGIKASSDIVDEFTKKGYKVIDCKVKGAKDVNEFLINSQQKNVRVNENYVNNNKKYKK